MLKIKKLNKIYKTKNREVKALNNVSLNINGGELVSICGTSGSGKTTLFNLICGIDRDYEGDILFENTNIRSLSNEQMCKKRRSEIGIIFQFFNLVSSLTVEENITLGIELNGETINQSRLTTLLKNLDLDDKRTSFIDELSGGQKQRVAIARTLLGDAKLILADEPTGNLDSENSKIIINLLKENLTNDKAILIITHDEEIANCTDRRIFFKDGKIISDETN